MASKAGVGLRESEVFNHHHVGGDTQGRYKVGAMLRFLMLRDHLAELLAERGAHGLLRRRRTRSWLL